MPSDLERAYLALADKKSRYDTLFAYYDGDQPLTYTATRLKDIFKDLDAYFAENWCSVVIDSTRDRVNLREVQIGDDEGSAAWREIWERSELALESDEIHEAAMVAGEGFLIAWPDDEDRPEGYHNDPRLVHMFYDRQYPRRKEFAAKWWVDADEKYRITLYYPDRLEKYRTNNKYSQVSDYRAFRKIEMIRNPYGKIPVFHFRLAQRKAKSDLVNVVPVQNGINKLLTDMMVTAEFQAFPQRYVISQVDTKGKLKNSPKEIWDIPAGDGIGQQTQVGQFASAELKNYLEAIDNMATAISSITRTPKHYFFSIGSNLSGEALIAMEAPLNKKAQDRIDRFIPVWKAAALFLLEMSGASVGPEMVTPVFDKPETVQPRTMAEARQLNVNAGMPLVTVLRDEGKSEAYLRQMLKDAEQQSKRNQARLSQALLDAQREFNQAGAEE